MPSWRLHYFRIVNILRLGVKTAEPQCPMKINVCGATAVLIELARGDHTAAVMRRDSIQQTSKIIIINYNIMYTVKPVPDETAREY